MKRKKRKKRTSKNIILKTTVFFLIILFTYSRLYQLSIEKELKEKKAELEIEIAKINLEIESLEYDIENSQSLEFIEKAARDDYNMVKPRELIYIIEEDIETGRVEEDNSEGD